MLSSRGLGVWSGAEARAMRWTAAAFQIWSGLGRRLGHWPAGVPVTMISDSVMQNQSHARLRMEGPKQLCRSDIINGSLVI